MSANESKRARELRSLRETFNRQRDLLLAEYLATPEPERTARLDSWERQLQTLRRLERETPLRVTHKP